VQACKALREEGYQVVLVNSNPATIMTDPEFADRTYIEPITPAVIESILEREKPDAILPTMGGQTALNAAMELNRNGALIRRAIDWRCTRDCEERDRQLFRKRWFGSIGRATRPLVRRPPLAERVTAKSAVSLIIRPAFTGSSGGAASPAIAGVESEMSSMTDLADSEVLSRIVESRGFEREVMRARAETVVGIVRTPVDGRAHGTRPIAPAQTLPTGQARDASFAVIRESGSRPAVQYPFALTQRTGG
jgi:carbamoyl-phosphate synthase large subunit